MRVSNFCNFCRMAANLAAFSSAISIAAFRFLALEVRVEGVGSIGVAVAGVAACSGNLTLNCPEFLDISVLTFLYRIKERTVLQYCLDRGLFDCHFNEPCSLIFSGDQANDFMKLFNICQPQACPSGRADAFDIPT